MKKSPISKQKKAAQTMREKYGEDYFSKIGTHSNRVTKGDSERMRDVKVVDGDPPYVDAVLFEDRSKACKYCLHKFESKVLPQHLRAVADFVAACGGFVQAWVALRESEVFLDQVAEFNRKYLKRDHNEVLESEVVSDDIGIIGSNRGCGVG